MIQFTFNKKMREIKKENSIFDFLSKEGILKKWVAIIVDEEPISVDESKKILIKDKMKIDIAHFVGGG